MISRIFGLLLAPAIVSATSLEYYRSAFCDGQNSSFFLSKYTVAEPLSNDNVCHQAPSRSMAIKLVDGLDPSCIVLAYDDYACTNLVGTVPANGKCVAATKAKIGSWAVRCGTGISDGLPSSDATYAPGELKRRGKQRLSATRDVSSTSTDTSISPSATVTVVASSVASKISSAIDALSLSKDSNANNTSSASLSAGAALSSAIESGSEMNYNLTAYVAPAPNATWVGSTLKTVTPTSTVTLKGTRSSNGMAILHGGASPSIQADVRRVMITALCGALAILVAVVL